MVLPRDLGLRGKWTGKSEWKGGTWDGKCVTKWKSSPGHRRLGTESLAERSMAQVVPWGPPVQLKPGERIRPARRGIGERRKVSKGRALGPAPVGGLNWGDPEADPRVRRKTQRSGHREARNESLESDGGSVRCSTKVKEKQSLTSKPVSVTINKSLVISAKEASD